MAKPSELRPGSAGPAGQEAAAAAPAPRPDVADLLGLGSHSARKSYYPELSARLDELERERNRYKWLFEHAVHGIFQGNLNHGILAANPALAHMLGYEDPQQVLWSRTDLAEQLFVGGAEELKRIGAVLRQGNGLFGYETQLRRRDGSHIDVLMNLLLKPDEEGLVEGFVADITERKQAQLRQQQLNVELERRVAARTAELLEANRHLQQEIRERERVQCELREARDAAEAANQSKDKYLAAASHDLLQPLNAARLLISTLRERNLPAAEGTLVERTHQALEGAEDLLADLLDIARLDSRAIRPDLAVYRLDELLAPLASEFQSVAEAAGLQLRVRIPRLAVHTDFRLLTRILRNFLSNACRYTSDGRVLLGCRRRGGYLSIQVADTGRGIPADKLEEIFLEFNQLEASRAAERKGVGLGLAIVERIARMLDYRVRVQSLPGCGSLFSIEVPLAEYVAAAPVARPQESPGNPLPGRRVLVVDNEPDIQQSMQALLTQWGCEVRLADGLEEARGQLAGWQPELLLVDYHLDQGANGCDLIHSLREESHLPLPAVIITAERSEQCRRHLHQLGIPLLNKPVKPGKLRAALSQFLS
ncbi:NahK/ErcS family hybrid sensor histidine kinase/response regulator [Pseudomonas sp. GCM10022188]|uniref:PAS domain-containing hybrid sensor histidine kinase/response regulator n=1 Tax=Pseudomonas TaxID=286 RepID=UPI001E40A5EE|nr:NahK/ErcS family hybrid sensor histidine kinase/response regulator [Pseudomonas oryzagri]MCC6074841.1 response regulator [Pseudomonas oryzagri]